MPWHNNLIHRSCRCGCAPWHGACNVEKAPWPCTSSPKRDEVVAAYGAKVFQVRHNRWKIMKWKKNLEQKSSFKISIPQLKSWYPLRSDFPFVRFQRDAWRKRGILSSFCLKMDEWFHHVSHCFPLQSGAMCPVPLSARFRLWWRSPRWGEHFSHHGKTGCSTCLWGQKPEMKRYEKSLWFEHAWTLWTKVDLP